MLFSVKHIKSLDIGDGSESKINSNYISAISQNHDIVVTCGMEMYLLLKNKEMQYQTLCSKCINLCWAPSGNIFLSCDEMLNLTFISAENFQVLKKIDLNKLKVLKEGVKYMRCTSHSIQNGFSVVVATSKSVLVYDSICEKPDSELWQKNFVYPKMFQIKEDFQSQDLLIYSNTFTNCLFAGTGTECLMLYAPSLCSLYLGAEVEYEVAQSVKKNSIVSVTDDGRFKGFTQLKRSYTSSLFYALDNLGIAYQFTLDGLYLLRWWPSMTFQSLCVEPARPSDKICSIFGLMKTSEDKFQIKVFGCPSIEERFTADCDEKIRFISGELELGSGAHYIQLNSKSDHLDVYHVTEIEPQSRFKHLVDLQEYARAEDLAVEFHLDRQYLYLGRLHHSICKMEEDQDEDQIKDLVAVTVRDISNILDIVNVTQHVLGSRIRDLDACCMLLSTCQRHLDAALPRLQGFLGDDIASWTSNQLGHTLDLLATYRMAFSHFKPSIDWNSFRNQAMSAVVMQLLSRGHFEEAATVWQRHKTDLMKCLESEPSALDRMLAAIPSDVTLSRFLMWMRVWLPRVLTSSIVDVTQVIATWLVNRVHSLEVLDESGWPNNGLQTARVFFDALNHSFSAQQQMSNTTLLLKYDVIGVTQLRMLMTQLEQLSKLRDEFKCDVTLREFIEETSETLTYRMLDKCAAPELIPEYLKRTVLPYMSLHQLDVDKTLFPYITKSLLSGLQRDWNVIPKLKQRKATVLIQHLTTDYLIAKSAAKLATHANIPWPRDVIDLITMAIDKCDHFVGPKNLCSEAEAIGCELRRAKVLAEIPSILSKYAVGSASIRSKLAIKCIVRFIERQGGDEALEDALRIADAIGPSLRLLVLDQRVRSLISRDQMDKVFKLFRKMDHQWAVKLLLRRKCAVQVRLEDVDNPEDRLRVAMSFIDIHNLVVTRCTVDACLKEELGYFVNQVRNLCALQVQHQLVMSLSSLSDRSSLKQRLEQCANHQIHSTTSSDDATKSRMTSLASKLQLGGEQVELTRIHETFQIDPSAAVQMCARFLDFSPSQQAARDVFRLLLRLLQRLENQHDVIAPLLPIALQILSKILQHCNERLLPAVTSLAALCNLAVDLHRFSDVTSRSRLHQHANQVTSSNDDDNILLFHSWFQEDDGLPLPAAIVLPALGRICRLLFIEDTSIGSSVPSNLKQCSKRLMDLTFEVKQLSQLLSDHSRIFSALDLAKLAISQVLDHILNHQDFIQNDADDVIENESPLMSALSTAKSNHDSLQQTLASLQLKKVLLSRYNDKSYAIRLALLLNHQSRVQLFDEIYSRVCNNCSKLQTFASVGIMTSLDYLEVQRFRSLLLHAKWADQLQRYDICPDDILRSSSEFRQQKLFFALLSSPMIDASTLENFATDFALNIDDVMISFLQVLLSGPQQRTSARLHSILSPPALPAICVGDARAVALPTESSYPFSSSKPTLPASTSRSVEDLRHQLYAMQSRVRDKSALLKQVEMLFFQNMCPYDYESGEMIFKFLQTSSNFDVAKALKLVHLLKCYHRRHPPTQMEKEQTWKCAWVERTPGPLSPASKDRIPLHPLITGDGHQSFSVLEGEISEDTIFQLLSIIRLLGLKEEDALIVATENLALRYQQLKSDEDPSFNDVNIFQKMQSISKKIETKKSLLAVATKLPKIFPIGPIRVQSYSWCVDILNDWLETTCNQKERKSMETLRSRLISKKRFAEAQSLFVDFHLDPADIGEWSSANKLIHKLYLHPSIVQRFHTPGPNYPDIHGLFDAVGKLYQLDYARDRTYVTLRFLQGRHPLSEDSKDGLTTGQQQNFKIYLIYVLSYPHSNPDYSAELLYKIFSTKQQRQVTDSSRVCALQCLLHVADDVTIQRVCGCPTAHLREQLKMLMFCTRLEKHDFHISVDKLKQQREGVARVIVGSQLYMRRPEMLQIAADICHHFLPRDSDLWSALLTHLFSCTQIDYLVYFLPLVGAFDVVKSLSCLPSIWQSCVSHPLSQLTLPLTPDETKVVFESYNFLMESPVLLQIDVRAISEHFLAVQQPALALGCLLMSFNNDEEARKVANLHQTLIMEQLTQMSQLSEPIKAYHRILQAVNQVIQ